MYNNDIICVHTSKMDPFLCEWVRACTETKPTNIHGKITGFRCCIWPWHFMLLLTGQMTVMHLTAGYKGFLFCKTASTSPTYILTIAIKNIAAHRGTAKYSMAWSYKLMFPGFFFVVISFFTPSWMMQENLNVRWANQRRGGIPTFATVAKDQN